MGTTDSVSRIDLWLRACTVDATTREEQIQQLRRLFQTDTPSAMTRFVYDYFLIDTVTRQWELTSFLQHIPVFITTTTLRFLVDELHIPALVCFYACLCRRSNDEIVQRPDAWGYLMRTVGPTVDASMRELQNRFPSLDEVRGVFCGIFLFCS